MKSDEESRAHSARDTSASSMLSRLVLADTASTDRSSEIHVDFRLCLGLGEEVLLLREEGEERGCRIVLLVGQGGRSATSMDRYVISAIQRKAQEEDP